MQRSHRQNNYWEPTYDPTSDPLSERITWSELKNNNGPNECICKAFTLEDIGVTKILKKEFRTCDFIDSFKFEKTFSFKDCTFVNCHFGGSNWENIKFQGCKFLSCAFGLTRFIRCQFISCTFDNISVSANETVFEKCSIDPESFIPKIKTNLDDAVLREKGITKRYQLYRLAVSKAKIAKNILLTLRDIGDEDLFISSIKVFSDQYTRSKLKQSYYFIQEGNWNQRLIHILIFSPRLFELVLIFAFGRLNKWGYGLGRISIIGIFLWFIFGSIYFIQSQELFLSYVKSLDILILAGYSKYSFDCMTFSQKLMQVMNLIMGLSWLSLFFPTLLNRTTSRFD